MTTTATTRRANRPASVFTAIRFVLDTDPREVTKDKAESFTLACKAIYLWLGSDGKAPAVAQTRSTPRRPGEVK